MSHGFVVKSDEDKVLVHSEAENLFFVDKATLDVTTDSQEISFDINAEEHVGDIRAWYKKRTVRVRVPKDHPNTASLTFFPFVDISRFSNDSVFSVQSVTYHTYHQTPTHNLLAVEITALVNDGFSPVVYLFTNSPEVVQIDQVEEINEYGVEVVKPSSTSGIPYKVYDSTKTPLVVTGTATVRPHSRVPIESGKDNLRVKTSSDIPVTSLNSKRTLMYCPMQADGGEYKSYEEDIKIQNCNTYTSFGPKKWCKTDRYRHTGYGLYAYYKAVFKVKNGTLRLSYLPASFYQNSQSNTYNKRRGDAIYGEIAGVISDTLSLPYKMLTGGGLAAIEDFTTTQFNQLVNWVFGTTANIPNVFLVDTFNKTRNSDHDYLVLFADKSLYD